MISDLTFLTNDADRKLSTQLNDLLLKSDRFDRFVGYFYLSRFYLIQKSLEPYGPTLILIRLETEQKVFEALQRAKSGQSFGFHATANEIGSFTNIILKQLRNFRLKLR